MSDRDRLTDMLQTGDEFNIFGGDVRSFQWLRTEGRGYLESEGLGGGNLTLALIAVTQIDLLGQCYVTLSNTAITNSRKEIQQTDAFKKLMRNLVGNWGYSEEEILEFWRRVRHKLVHKSYPKAVIAVPNPKNFESISDLLRHAERFKDKPFTIDDDVIIVKADSLLCAVEDIKQKLISMLINGEFGDQQIANTLEFIES